MQCELHRDLLAQGERFARRFILVDGQAVKLTGVEAYLGVVEEVITGLSEAGFSEDRSEVEVPLVYALLWEGLPTPPYHGAKEPGIVYTPGFLLDVLKSIKSEITK